MFPCQISRTQHNAVPSNIPSVVPTCFPSLAPSVTPNYTPSVTSNIPTTPQTYKYSQIPTVKPTIVPNRLTVEPSVEHFPLCRWQGICVYNTDCYSGMICVVSSVYWGLCNADPALEVKTPTCYTTGNDWGCTTNSDCCNPSAVSSKFIELYRTA